MKTPMLIWGPPGCGKSAAAAQWAAANYGQRVITYVCSQEDPADTAGVIGENADGTSSRRVPAWWKAACNDPHAVILEELTAAEPQQMAAVLRATDDAREIAGHRLHAETVVIATANPPEMAAGAARSLAPPILSRFRHTTVPDGAAADFLLGGAGWCIQWPAAAPIPGMRAIVATYWQCNPGAATASAEEIASAEATQSPFPTPRAWCRAADEEGDLSLWHEYIGRSAAAQFLHWFTCQDLPNPLEIVAGRCSTIPARGDAVMTTANAVASLIKRDAAPAAIAAALTWYAAAAAAGHVANCVAAVIRIVQTIGTARASLHAAELTEYTAAISAA